MNLKSMQALPFLLILLTGCSFQVQQENSAAPELLIITATLPPTATPLPSRTPLPPPPQTTVAPVEGTTSTQLNVRAEPSTTSDVIGIIAANSKVKIIGRDVGDNWWQIIYDAGVDGFGWVTAQYVEIADNLDVPVIGADGSNQQGENTAVVIQQLNIRSGPGTNFNSLGILSANDVVNLTGKNREGSWLQIDFAEGPNGKGWVSAGFVKAEDATNLPIISEGGQVIGTGTPVDTPLPPSPTLIPAPMDFDSADNPTVSVIFEAAGTNSLIYSGDVSSPDGDPEDWIAFTPYGNFVYAGIQCTGKDDIRIEFIANDTALTCNYPTRVVSVFAGSQNLLHIQIASTTSQLRYVQYTLTIKSNP